MMSNRRKAVVVLGLMCSSFGAAAVWKPTTRLADQRPQLDLESLFPKRFAGWQVDERIPVQLVSPDTAALLSKIYNQVLSRTYVNSAGQRIMLSVAYGGDQSDSTRAHRPEVCYPAQGFAVSGSRESVIRLDQHMLPVRRLEARLGARVEPITYWIVVGETPVTSGVQQKLAQLRYGARGIVPDGMLVRVSSIDTDMAVAFDYQAQFVRDMALAIATGQRPQVVGQAGPGR